LSDDYIDFYSDEDNPKERKIANKMIYYALGKKKKLTGEKLKVKKSRMKHEVIITGNSKKNREIKFTIS
jgi:hypothetical protein